MKRNTEKLTVDEIFDILLLLACLFPSLRINADCQVTGGREGRRSPVEVQ